MKDTELRDLVAKRRDASFKHVSGRLQRDRSEALQFYRGDNLPAYGDSGGGLSTVVSRDTMEAIESMMPSLCKPFVSGDEVVRFEPTGPEDEEGAKQATEYVNYVFNNHNDPFRVIYDSVKDGLLFRLGVAKVVHEVVEETSDDRYEGVDEFAIAAIDAAEDIEIVGGEVEGNPDGTFNVNVQKTQKRGTYRVINVAPDAFMYEPRLRSLDDATFLGDHAEKTVGDLIAMGLPKAKCEKLAAGRPSTMDTTDEERFSWEGESESLNDDDPARKVWVDECYIRCNYQGDGVLRWRRVIVAGADNTILLDEEADDHPYEAWTPIPEPHKLVGQSIADLTRDIQLNKTALQREANNALYLANRPMREVVEGQVNIDDLMQPAVDGIVRVKAAGMVNPIATGTPAVAAQAFAAIEYYDTTREARTGVTRYNQGLDANSLNKTATGVSIISNASMQRQELIARQYAESFLKGVFRKLLKLVSRYQDKAAVVRLRGQWVEMDPTDWKTGYDMSVSVGLGTGNKQEMIGQLTNLLSIQQQVAEGQGGLVGPLVRWPNIHETLTRLTEAMGLKGVERYFADPESEEQAPQEPQEDPNAVAQAQLAAEQADKQAERQQTHDTAVQTATIKADADVRIASIEAVKDMVVAGLTVDEAEAVVQAAPDVFPGPEVPAQPETPIGPEIAPEAAEMAMMDAPMMDPAVEPDPLDPGLPPEMQL